MPENYIGIRRNPVIVLIHDIDSRVIHAMRYAASLSKDVTAFCVAVSEEEEKNLHARWDKMNSCIPFITRTSMDGGIVYPLMRFIKSSEYGCTSEDMVTVVLPQIVYSNKWKRLQQYSVSKYLERKLSKRGQIVFVVFPIHLPDGVPATDSFVG